MNGISPRHVLTLFRYKLLSMLSTLCDERDRIMADIAISPEEKRQKVNDLMLDYNGTKCKVNELGYEACFNVDLISVF